MITSIANPFVTGTHKPLVDGSNPSAATSKAHFSPTDQGTTQNQQAYLQDQTVLALT